VGFVAGGRLRGAIRRALWGLGRLGLIAPVSLGLPLATQTHVADLRPVITVLVQDQRVDLSPGLTFSQVVSRRHVVPEAGDLLDVEGDVLRDGVYPGHIVLNGERPDGDPRLFDGWAIDTVPGRDRTEHTVTKIVPIPPGTVSNPQFLLGNQPGEQVITKGAISDKVVSSVFRPTGPADRPLEVALTFDDGPWPDSTEQILATLKKYKVKATFFVVGNVAEKRPELVKKEMGAGMEVENHSWSHPTSFADLPAKRIRQEIRECRDYLKGLGVTSRLFRPPGGSYSDRVLRIARKLGARLTLWSVDPRDWADDATAKQISKSVLDAVRPGSIVLLHDGGGDQSATVKALPRIIRGIKSMGLGFTTVAEGS
jgi:peptidoglycan/xylan/chitin deacetylase (PgdA/CDA1 family)